MEATFIFAALQEENQPVWIIIFAYALVLGGLFAFILRVIDHNYAVLLDKPMFRNYVVYRKLPDTQKALLQSRFSFYNKLGPRQKRQFEHRVATFVRYKKFVGRESFAIEEQHKTLIAAVGCMLSFGRRNYRYTLLETILVFPGEFYSTSNEAYHKGEFNPRERVMVLSWKDFEHGYEITNDNLNLGIHEFMHAMQLEATVGKDLDSARFIKYYKNILRRLTQQELKDKLDETRFFRAYAFTNQYEFMAVLAEYFFEAPTEFREHFPQLYAYKKKLLNFNFAGY